MHYLGSEVTAIGICVVREYKQAVKCCASEYKARKGCREGCCEVLCVGFGLKERKGE